MNIKAKILASKVDEQGRFLIKAQCNGKLPPVGTRIDIRYGAKRSNSQNA